ncbi:MAG TPA: DNA repair protein RadA [Candidatus Gastranaerophilaceae bacterium]|nr:DNA repair protein RadA [Candidatus Gastranaerophilaceae bacterium]
MAKVKTKWICQECGYESAGYLGKCPECSAWGSLVEEVQQNFSPVVLNSEFFDNKPSLINEIEINEEIRTQSSIKEFDRVLGGGFVTGSVTLLAGDPGIGKSTLVLQACGLLCRQGKKVLYVCAEESANQIKLRAQRLGVNEIGLYIYPQTNFELIKKEIENIKPDFVVVDSIQAIYSQEVSSSAGSVSQIRECCNFLIQIAKNQNITMIVIGHVTKDGNIAGPKVLEHMVDTVVYFEGDKYKSYRLLRSVKNRFGNTAEAGIFEMGINGLAEVINPGGIFIQEHSQEVTPGSVIISTSEGTRPLLVEIQALVGTTPYPSPRRVANGVDFGRVLQILAVLEKRVGLNLSKQDVYVNVIGGIEISEPAADLGIALAVATCARDVVVDSHTVIIGEIGLSGEIRAVQGIDKRIKEAQILGFKKAIIPFANKDFEQIKGIEIIKAKRLIDAISACVSRVEA